MLEGVLGATLKSSNLLSPSLVTQRPPAAEMGRILCKAAVAGVMIVE
jgi:hypothetical protein